MERLVLKESVRIYGPSFLGNEACVRLVPVEQPGWHWQLKKGRVQLEPRMMRLGRNYLYLQCGSERMYICEHLLSLKTLTGLDGVCIFMETRALPFDASAQLYWRTLEPYLRSDGMLTSYAPCDRVCSDLRRLRVGKFRFIQIIPMDGETLQISVASDYPKRKQGAAWFTFPNSIEKVHAAKGYGGAGLRQRAARIARVFGWPHYEAFAWPDGFTEEEFLRNDAAHRAIDIAGGLSLLAPPGAALVGLVESHCAGHIDDYGLVQKIMRI